MPKLLKILKHLPTEQRLFRRRVWVIGVILLFLVLVLLARLVYLQVWQYQRYKTMAQQNHIALVALSPRRGLIFDRHGTLLADNKAVYSLVLFPDQVDAISTRIAQLRRIVRLEANIEQQIVQQQRLRGRFSPIVLSQQLTEEEVAAFSLNHYHFPGIQVQSRLLRYYPLAAPFAAVVGYVGQVNEQEQHATDFQYGMGDMIGKTGVEHYYEKILRGIQGYQQVEINVSGKRVRVLAQTLPIAGEQLYLTIDAGLQCAAQRALGRQAGAIVALDPRNGEVLALVSSPTFDPNIWMGQLSTRDYQKLKNNKGQPLYNRAVRGHYPPASIVKPFLGVGALKANVIRSTDTIHDTGQFQIMPEGRIYRNIYQIAWGETDLRKAIAVSSDIYFYQLSLKMGVDRIAESLGIFGYGKPTAIDLSGEASGLLPTRYWKRRTYGEAWYLGDTVNLGIGQGFMLVTPLQMAVATGTLAMSGQRWQPHVLLGTQSTTRNFIAAPATALPKVVMQPRIWHFIHHAMQAVVKQGSAQFAFAGAPYTLAAKTGTAQVFSLKPNQHYDADQLTAQLRDHSLFIAFAPLDKPEIALAVVIENSLIPASRVARRVLDYYFNHRMEITQKIDCFRNPVIKGAGLVE